MRHFQIAGGGFVQGVTKLITTYPAFVTLNQKWGWFITKGHRLLKKNFIIFFPKSILKFWAKNHLYFSKVMKI